MQPFITYTGIVVPLDRINVDTDAIIPKQFLRAVERSGFGPHLFHEWRLLDYEGRQENPDFVLNKPAFRGATVLLTRDNFGCGSSREHAVWALADYGFRVVVATSFAEIFYNNCVKNGLLVVTLKSQEVDELFQDALHREGAKITADLNSQTLSGLTGKKYSFEIHPFAKECLLKGLDQIGWTLQFDQKITNYEKKNYNNKTMARLNG